MCLTSLKEAQSGSLASLPYLPLMKKSSDRESIHIKTHSLLFQFCLLGKALVILFCFLPDTLQFSRLQKMKSIEN